MIGKQKTRWILVLSFLVFSAMVCVMCESMRQETLEATVMSAGMSVSEAGEQTLQVGIYGRNAEEHRSLALWHTEEEEPYFLFLPDWAYGEEGGIALSFSKEVEVEGKTFPANQKIYQEKQRFLIRDEEREYAVETVRLSKLPSIYIDTESGSLETISADKHYRENIKAAVLDETGRGEQDLTGKIKCRGNASFTYAEKKSYEIELDAEADLYGMGTAGRWILLANYFDPTYLRNGITFYIAERMGMEGTPAFCWVDVFANGEYQGNYLLCEKVEIHEGRLDIRNLEAEQGIINNKEVAGKAEFSILSEDGESAVRKGFRWEKEPEDISGGYLLELESIASRYEEEESGFISDGGQMAVVRSPKRASAAQIEYISGLYQKFEDAVRSEEEPEAFLEYIDLESFVKKYLIEEMVKNKDASVSSLYLYKPEDGKSTRLFAGPVWDYDNAYGNDDKEILYSPEGIFVRDAHYGTAFWSDLCRNPYFMEEVRRVYAEELFPILHTEVEGQIVQWKEQIRQSVYADTVRWNGKGWADNFDYDGKVAEVTEFIRLRTEYLREEWEE